MERGIPMSAMSSYEYQLPNEEIYHFLHQHLGLILAIFAVVIIVAIALSIFYIICWWRIYEKAGQPGWAALIPFYNTVVMLRVGGMNPWWTVAFYLPLFANFALRLAMIFSAPGLHLIMVLMVVLLLSLIPLVLWIILSHRISKAFGHDIGFTLGLIFLSFIFVPILAFNKDQWRKIERG